MRAMSRFFFRLLRIEPGISLGQWVYDRIVNNWAALVAFAGASMTYYFGVLTEWVRVLGPLGLWLIVLAAGLALWIIASTVGLLRSRAENNRAYKQALELWARPTEAVNPAASEFTEKRINLRDLVLPGSMHVRNKSFNRCEIVGPTNIIFNNTVHPGSQAIHCDGVIARSNAGFYNAIFAENCVFNSCTFTRVTLIYYNDAQIPQNSTINWVSVHPPETPAEPPPEDEAPSA